MATALVLLSGGQDSTTCLAWALERFDKVETIGFHYGQRHAVEMDCRKAVLLHLRSFPAWGNRLADDHVVDLGVIKQLGTTAMTDDIRIEMQKSGLPNTFVPGRNLLLHRRRSCRSTRRRRGRSPSSSAARRSSTSSSSTRTAATSATGHAGTTGATAAVPVPPAS